MSVLLEIAEPQKLEFESNIIVAGYLAAVYSNKFSGTPYRGWGKEYLSHPPTVNGNRIVATPETRKVAGKLTPGLKVVVHMGVHDGGTEKRRFWVSKDALEKCTLSFDAAEEG